MAERPKSEKELRAQRLQAALRENLKRRKVQARSRAENAVESTQSHDSAGIPADKERG